MLAGEVVKMKRIFMDLDNVKICDSKGNPIKRIDHEDMKLDRPLYELAEALALYDAVNRCMHEDEESPDKVIVEC